MSNFKIAIVGAGVVGQATGKGLTNLNNEVFFIDTNSTTLRKLEEHGFNTTKLDKLHITQPDFIFLCLPTPTNSKSGQVDLSFIESLVQFLSKYIKNINKRTIIVLRSTVPVGTTDKLISQLEHGSGKLHGDNFGVCFNPEYLREKSAEEDFLNPRLTIIGTEESYIFESMSKLYKPITKNIFKLTTREAEMHKYVHNLYNACKISFFNEFRTACNALNVNPENIFPLVVQSAEASWNTNYGIKDLGAYGGSCLPKDTLAFFNFMKKHNIHMDMLNSIIKVNNTYKSST